MMSRFPRLQRVWHLAAMAVTARGLTADHASHGPLYAQVGICDPCDHRCVMCPYHPPSEERAPLEQFGGRPPGIMSLATFEKLMDELASLGTRRVDLVGRGEPLLSPDVIAMIQSAKQRGMDVTMISNGSRLTRLADALAGSGLDRLRISLDAATAETYDGVHVGEGASYARVLEGIRRVVEVRRGSAPHVSLSFTLGALNHHELVEMVETSARVGADGAHFQHVLPLGPDASATALSDAARKDLGRMLDVARRRARALGLETNLRTFAASEPAVPSGREVVPCYVGAYFTVVLGNGHVMPCCQGELPVGSLHEHEFGEVWNDRPYRAFRRAARNLPRPDPALATCACDRCYFRAHNVTVHNVLHPLSVIRDERPEALLSVDHLLRMSRADRR